MSGELALESIDADGQGQHEPYGGIHGCLRDGPHPHGLRAPEPAGGQTVEPLLVSHAVGIDPRPGHL